ncbi:MAG: PocR ligand-binding domain-containing protein [Clostridiales bacterium]|nr:PocR ligand-binding domain-containing protein [Clostridiales bacterium]
MNETWINLYDTVKTAEFQHIQDNLAKSTDLAIITVDYKGRPLNLHSECSEFCSQIRILPKYAELCEKCDSHGGLEAARSKKPFIYMCHANIVDIAVPIIINDMYLGAIMAGQIRLDQNEPSPAIETIYRLTDLKTLFDEKPTLKTLYEKLPTISYSKIESSSKILQTICQYMVQNPGEKLLNELTLASEPVVNITQRNSSELLMPAMKYLEEHFSEKNTLKHLAQICNVSDSYFSRLFSKTYGISIMKYIESLRLNHAKQLLLNPDFTVKYVALSCGYEDASYFIKLFKKATGITPQNYRRTIGK